MTTRTKVQSAVNGLLATTDYQGLTYEGIAAASGVAKTTLYRHWPTKAELVFDLVLHDRQLPPLRTSGSATEIAQALAERIVAFVSAGGVLAIFAGLLAELTRSPELAERFRASFVRNGEAELRTATDSLRGPSDDLWTNQDVQLILLGSAHAWLSVGGLTPAETRLRLERLILTLLPGK